MANVLGVTTTVKLRYDDGTELTVSTPEYVRDIRDGDFLPLDDVLDVIKAGGRSVREAIKLLGLAQLHRQAIIAELRPDDTPPFSENGKYDNTE